MSENDFSMTSPAFVPDAIVPAEFTCDGENTSPELQWMHAPDGTRSFVLIVDDPDASTLARPDRLARTLTLIERL